MLLTELKVNEFVDLLASNSPAPGGGSASALAASLGIALTGMVAALTAGREKYKEHNELMEQIIEQSNELKIKLLSIIDRDTEAYNGVTAVFKMPKATDDEKAKRKEAMQNALKESTKVPFELMVCTLEALELAEKALGKSNPNAASDLGVGSLNLKSAMQGAWLNVLSNVGGINDQEFVNEHKTKGTAILEKALPLADKIYNEILASL